MLFNSYLFIFAFLPITLAGYFLIGRTRPKIALLWVFFASLIFYGWWNVRFVGLLLASISINYGLGICFKRKSRSKSMTAKWFLAAGVGFNIAVLGHFKFADFFITNINALLGISLLLYNIILPVGLSFYTFLQNAYLVDAYRNEAPSYKFLDYGAFVAFFPHLLCGPIVHHRELIPQYAKTQTFRFSHENVSIGLIMFFIGLFEKIALADNLCVYSDTVFGAAARGFSVTFYEGWIGALAYTFQIYFDFCGYSNMAIGLSRMFNIWYPMNFDSPYKATSIIDFWRRWHITLSRFIKKYLYIPLGGNRKGNSRRYLNLMISMLLGGLWHGAGWTFVFWGALHGIYLAINHFWRHFVPASSSRRLYLSRFSKWVRRILTLIFVVFAWVLFRAQSLSEAWEIFRAMMRIPLIEKLPEIMRIYGKTWVTMGSLFENGLTNVQLFSNRELGSFLFLLGGSLIICWFLPNAQEYLAFYKPALEYPRDHNDVLCSKIRWQPTVVHFLFVLALAVLSLGFLDNINEFIYYQF